MRLRPWRKFVIALVASMGLGLLVAAVAANSAPSKPGPNPEAGMTDQQRLAIRDAAHARNAQYLNDFVAQGRDPHSLPVIQVGTYGAPVSTLNAAVSASDEIAHVRVRGVNFANDPSGGMPTATTTLDVIGSVKGASSTVLVIHQVGGPVWQAPGGALAELDTDPLLLPGDEAIVMLKRDSSGFMRPLIGVGVTFVKNGRVQAEDANPFGAILTGHTADELMASLASYVQALGS
ncbi:MAG TPA: hypothetical protein VF214_04685 [Edaphobacter sp.]